MARPVTVGDSIIFEAVFSIILEEGMGNLTFDNVAAKVGLVRTAIANRFKNKHSLLVAADAYYLTQSSSLLEQAAANAPTAVQAIVDGLCAEMRFATSPKAYSNSLSLLSLSITTPELYQNYRQAYSAQQTSIASLLERAKEEGAFRQDMQSHEVAQQIQIAQQGAAHTWMVLQEGSIDGYIKQSILTTLEPYKEILESTSAG